MPADTFRSVHVQNARTREARMFLGLTPREAVMAAYAGCIGGRDAQGLEDLYGRLVSERHGVIHCGDWRTSRT